MSNASANAGPLYGRPLPRRLGGFTLIELLVVVSIIGLLVAMLLPAVGMVRDQAKSAMCQNRLRQIGLCFSNYTAHNDGIMPWGATTGFSWSAWYLAITETTPAASPLTAAACATEWAATGASEWAPLFFCSEDPNSPKSDAAKLGHASGTYFWYKYAVSHGYNAQGLGGMGNTAFGGSQPYREPASLSSITKSSATVLVADNMVITYEYTVKAGHGLLGAGPGTWVIYPRHSGNRTSNILWVDGHVSSITAAGPGNYSSLYQVTALGKNSGAGDLALDSLWDRK
jgi:prepilin-type processing-associated H-X9-DG protein/prepilin-type N-terminal cleavage/methylation domain-containing protein